MVVCDEVVNTPTDGKERAVMDSFQGISLAPVDSTFSFVSFSKPSIFLLIGLISNFFYSDYNRSTCCN